MGRLPGVGCVMVALLKAETCRGEIVASGRRRHNAARRLLAFVGFLSKRALGGPRQRSEFAWSGPDKSRANAAGSDTADDIRPWSGFREQLWCRRDRAKLLIAAMSATRLDVRGRHLRLSCLRPTRHVYERRRGEFPRSLVTPVHLADARALQSTGARRLSAS